jgi:UDP:flavonoid glycosyltransferase YjiC (YdhE family)
MKKFLFSTADFPGYLDWGGLLQTACYLRDNGHQVLWLSGPVTEPLLQKMNIETVQGTAVFNFSLSSDHCSASAQSQSKRYRILNYYLDMLMDEEMVSASCETHMRLISSYSPDAVISDPTILGAKLSTEAAGVPFAGCGYPGGLFVIPREPEMLPLLEKYNSRLVRLRGKLGLRERECSQSPDILFISEDLHLVYTTPEWFQDSDSRPSPGALYVGGRLSSPQTPPPAWLDELPADRPLILIGRSTNYRTTPAAIEAAFEVIKRVEGYGLIGGAVECRANFDRLPDYIRWESWMPYEHVMPIVDAVIHHGGLGTSCLAVRHGIPQVIVPEVPDNYIHAHAIVRNEAGLAVFPHELNLDGLVSALDRILHEPKFRDAAQRLRKRFAELGGAPRAADRLLQFAG